MLHSTCVGYITEKVCGASRDIQGNWNLGHRYCVPRNTPRISLSARWVVNSMWLARVAQERGDLVAGQKTIPGLQTGPSVLGGYKAPGELRREGRLDGSGGGTRISGVTWTDPAIFPSDGASSESG